MPNLFFVNLFVKIMLTCDRKEDSRCEFEVNFKSDRKHNRWLIFWKKIKIIIIGEN